MTSWITLLADRLARGRGRRRMEDIQEALGEAGYVDALEWARLNRMSPEEAEEELERGVRIAILKKMYLYEGADSPITFVVPETHLDTMVRLSEIGYFGGDEDRELLVSKYHSRPVYVDARG